MKEIPQASFTRHEMELMEEIKESVVSRWKKEGSMAPTKEDMKNALCEYQDRIYPIVQLAVRREQNRTGFSWAFSKDDYPGFYPAYL